MAIPGSARVLLDFIGLAESGKTGPDAYLVIYGNHQSSLPKPLTEYTLDELTTAQKTWGKNWRSSAAGKYQIVRATLVGLIQQIGLRGDQHFTSDLQDTLGYTLLTGRGFLSYVTGTRSIQDFALGLAKEWASMPVLAPVKGAQGKVLKRGQSYYANDGLNSALVTPEEFEAVLVRVLAKPASKPATPPQPVPAPSAPTSPETPPAGFWQALWGIVVAVLTAIGKALGKK